mmetsp:Transcript_28123/g.66026  ORF Transcript_28123/g.66026 Transcript_28123/m.66026 type:complete len:617 (-) Transcript_28123:50-1900(-)
MYSRAERHTAPGSTATPSEVGPGSYLRTENAPAVHGYAPFGSTATRTLNAAPGAKAPPGPGPGSYTREDSRTGAGVREGGSGQPFKSRVPRFAVTRSLAEQTPGPGQYSLPSSLASKGAAIAPPPNRQSSQVSQSQEATGAVAWFRVPTAPSIPTHSQSFGYEETAMGDLVMQRPPPGVGHSGANAGDSVGPGSYDPRLPTANSAPAFARRSARKTMFDISAETGDETPGPGSYQPRSEFTLSADFQGGGVGGRGGARGSSTFRSRTKMAYQSLIDPETITPGPNAYQDISSRSMLRPAPPPHLQFFGTTQQRLPGGHYGTAAAPAGPGPGSYNLKPHLRVPERPAASAFNQTSLRFAGDVELARRASMPGPGQYAAPSFADDVRKKPSGRKGVFGSTARRFSEVKKQDLSAANYASNTMHGTRQVPPSPPQTTVPKANGPSSSFSSTVPRFNHSAPDSLSPAAEAAAAAATVGVAMSGGHVAGAAGRRRRQPETTPASTSYQVPSGNSWDPQLNPRPQRKSTLSTFGAVGHQELIRASKDPAPGPGQYDPRLLDEFRKQRSAIEGFVSREPRMGKRSVFGVAELTPGPGAYETTADSHNPMLKRSFNITLGELAF